MFDCYWPGHKLQRTVLRVHWFTQTSRGSEPAAICQKAEERQVVWRLSGLRRLARPPLDGAECVTSFPFIMSSLPTSQNIWFSVNCCRQLIEIKLDLDDHQ